MKVFALRDAFNRKNVLAVGFGDLGEAGRNTLAVHQHRASTALAFATAVLCPGQMDVFAQDVQQRAPRIRGGGPGLAIDGEVESSVHVASTQGRTSNVTLQLLTQRERLGGQIENRSA